LEEGHGGSVKSPIPLSPRYEEPEGSSRDESSGSGSGSGSESDSEGSIPESDESERPAPASGEFNPPVPSPPLQQQQQEFAAGSCEGSPAGDGVPCTKCTCSACLKKTKREAIMEERLARVFKGNDTHLF